MTSLADPRICARKVVKNLLDQVDALKARKAMLQGEAIYRMIEEDWQWQLEDNPEYATQAGQHQYDGNLQDVSPSAFEARADHDRKLLAKAELMLSKAEASSPNGTATMHLKLFVQDLQDELRAFLLGCHLYPVNSIGYGGVHNNFIEALDWLPENPDADTNFLSRLEAFPTQCEGYKELLRLGVSKGKVASCAMLRKVAEQLQALAAQVHAVDCSECSTAPLFSIRTGGVDSGSDHVRCVACSTLVPEEQSEGPIKQRIAKLLLTTPSLAGRAAAALSLFHSAVTALVAFFTAEYSPHARQRSGCMGMIPEGVGSDVYAHCLKYHTTTNMSAAEIHETGLAEVARIEARYQRDVMDQLAFKGSFKQFVAHCHSPESGHYYTRSEDLLDDYRALCGRIQLQLPHYFETLPAACASLEIVEKNAPTAPAAYYMQGTADGSRPGRFYVNVSNLEQRPRYEMVALALHEGIPGHHFQGSLAIENASIPSFLRFIEDRRYEYCPARRQLYAAYLEGWALYCEALGEEMGMYCSAPSSSDSKEGGSSDGQGAAARACSSTGNRASDPMQIFGRLSMEMMRAVRLVVDTAIHSQGWSVERAIEYMMEKTGMHRHECEAECYRYEAWPGQACAYKVGEVAIWRMRRSAEERLGPKFDLKRFHTVLLSSGPMPLDTLASMVESWVEETERGQGKL
jgi:uncharacterized protein (DUF885 family)